MVGGNLLAAIIAVLVPELVGIVRVSGKKIAVAVLGKIVERAIEKELSKNTTETRRKAGG